MDLTLNHIICRFGVPSKIVVENAMIFKDKPLVAMCQEYGINQTYASNYNPRGHGQVESRNFFFEDNQEDIGDK